MQCPKCHGLLEDDGSCSCGYGVKRKAVERGDGLTGQLCAFLDHGRSCPCRGVFSSTTNGAGKWYCREHWERIQGLEPEGLGNFRSKSKARSHHMRQWDEWVYNPKTRRLERAPEPGSDIDLESLVPEEVGQA